MRRAILTALIDLLICVSLIPVPVFAQKIEDDIKLLEEQVVQLNREGKYAEAIPLAQRLLEIRLQFLDPNNKDIPASFNYLALLYKQVGQYEKAEPLYLQAQDLDRKIVGKDHQDFARDLNNLAALYVSMGRYEKAERLYVGAEEIDRKIAGENSVVFATDLNNLAGLYEETGQYAKAEPLFVQAIEIKRKALGENHPSYARSINNLAALYDSMGEQAKAEPLYIQTNQIIRKTVGENHPDYATNLNNLGLLYEETGQYGKAEPLLVQALEIRKKTLGENHPDFAQSLNNLALLYSAMGQYQRAETLYQRAIDVDKNTLGENHANYARDIDNLALLYGSTRQYEKAESLLIQAVEIRRKALGENHPVYARALSNLAGLYEERGEYQKAEPLLLRAKEIDSRALGENHPDYATDLNNLAALYGSTKQYEKAEPLLLQTREIIRKTLGENHSYYANVLDNLALVYTATNRTNQAVTTLSEALRVQQTNARHVFDFSSEPAMRAYLSNMSNSLDVLINLAANRQASNHQDVQTAFDWVLRRKAMILDTLIQFREAELLFEREPRFAQTRARYLYVNQQLSNLPLGRPVDMNDTDFQRKMLALSNERDQLQADLNRTLSASRSHQSNDADVAAVRQKLKPGSALVEFVRADMFDFKATDRQQKWNPAHYFAFVLTADANSQARMIDLGDAAQIDQAIKKVRNSIIQFGEKWKTDTNRILNEAEYERQYRVAARHLYDLVFAPAAQTLGTAKMVYVAADSQLNLVSFDALVNSDNQYLIENGYSFAYLASGRDLLRVPANGSHGAVVFADPDYNMSTVMRAQKVNQMLADLDKPSTGQTANRGRTPLAYSGDLSSKTRGINQARGGRWDRLPASRKEADDVQQELGSTGYGPVKKYLGGEALEEVFKRIRSPRLLHISTHGFFPDETFETSAQTRQSNSGSGLVAILGQRLLQNAAVDNPLLSTGVVLSGANSFGDRTATETIDDGWVTAEEIAMMHLDGTQLVVLSACGSGLGAVSAGEGVYGLRRAFQNAGARTIVATLFEVPDKESELMMKTFYAGIKTGKGKLESLKDAELKMINERRKNEGTTHPYFWASFVLAGDPN